MAEKTKLHELTGDELKARLNDTSNELISARRKARVGQFKKTSDFPRLRKEIARIKTQLRWLELKAGRANSEGTRASL
jgi:ribosomal protein L29